MESFATAPASTGHTKQYVFVDEYNRHKRLKVMRACDGCRKRKIRCDGALQNGPWPCGACLRLKLKCIPPTLDPDEDQQTSASTSGQGQFSFQSNTTDNGSAHVGTSTRPQRIEQWAANITPATSNLAPVSGMLQQDVPSSSYTTQFFSQQADGRLYPGHTSNDYLTSPVEHLQPQQHRAAPSLLRSHTEASSASSGDPHEVNATVRELSEQMGDLSIETDSVAPYITNEKRTLAETPAVEEIEPILPASVGSDTIVRIPPEMMPTDDRVMDYFGYFFNYIHPYVPVLNRASFYDQWRSARHSISPLILEGIFACVARYLEEPIEVRKWLALAARHEESFKDVPRLSTIQAMILLTKAREFVPRRGYYYRSWMAVKYMTTMACDVSLNEHAEQHRLGNACKLTKAECMVRARIWQTLFCLEIMVGAPQGRTDYSVDTETVEFNLPNLTADVDPFEHQTSRRLAYMTQAFRNIRESNKLFQIMKRHKKDWALDPTFVRRNEEIAAWVRQLPSDMQVHYPADDSPPWLASDHFVGYIHCYHHLVVVMHHRPQLQALLEKRDPSFKTHLEICLQSAAKMCKIQEALVRDFGLHGLQFMQRGISFTIYAVLTCTMLHLAAVTAPDPDFNSRARNFFTRHMRILEQCIPSASVEMQAQIDALREAFSQDTSRPFELKPSLGLRSPSLESNPTPPQLQNAQPSMPIQNAWPHLQDATSSKTMSPASDYRSPFEQMPSHSIPGQANMAYHGGNYQIPDPVSFSSQNLHQATSAPQTGYALERVISNEHPSPPAWDPSGIFIQWNSAFGGQPQPPPQPQVPDPRVQQTSAPYMPSQQSPPAQQTIYASQPMPSSAGSLAPETAPPMPTVTPLMWQDAFTTAYVSGHGNKRYRDNGVDQMAYQQYAKRRG